MFNNSRTTRKITQSLALVTPATPFFAACGSNSNEAAGDTITFAAVPAKSSQSLQSDYNNLVKPIVRGTGKEVEFQNASDYAAVVEGQHAGKTDIASYDPFSYIIAHNSGIPIEAVASPVNNESKASAYASPAYVKEGSDIESLKDLRGKKVCSANPASASGYLVPTKGLMDEGLEPDADLEPVVAGGHDVSLFTLSDDGCDVAFTHDAILKTLEKSGQIKPGALKSTWESEPVAENPIALNAETIFAEDLAKIRAASSDEANKPALVKEGICSSKEDYTLPEKIE